MNEHPSYNSQEKPSDILYLELNTTTELYTSYLPFIKGSGLFIATEKSYQLGEEIFLLVKLMGEAEKYSVAAKIVWITPFGAQGRRRAGIGVQFIHGQAEQIRNKIETYLAGILGSDKPTDTL